MKRVLMLAALAVLVLPVMASAQADVDRGTYDYVGIGTYSEGDGSGIAEYYGLPVVYCIYRNTVTWHSVLNGNGLVYKYNVSGTVEFYDGFIGGNLLGTKKYSYASTNHTIGSNDFAKNFESIPPFFNDKW